MRSTKNKQSYIVKKLYYANGILFILLTATYFVLFLLNKLYVNNDFINILNIYRNNVLLLWLLSSLFIGLGQKKIIRIQLSIIVAFLLIENLVFLEPKILLKNLYFILKNPYLSYEQKMRYQVGDLFYDYTSFIKHNTPETATILIPPQAYPWPQTGNPGYLRYFLYPRKLVSGKEYEAGVDLSSGKIDFVLIAKGESQLVGENTSYGWPKFSVSADTLVFFEKDLGGRQFKDNYVFSEAMAERWGLIKLRK